MDRAKFKNDEHPEYISICMQVRLQKCKLAQTLTWKENPRQSKKKLSNNPAKINVCLYTMTTERQFLYYPWRAEHTYEKVYCVFTPFEEF